MFFFFNDTATTEIYTLSLHDALPISSTSPVRGGCPGGCQRAGTQAVCTDVYGSGVPIAGASRRDRKSTRLNSSHVRISYAVFCLKKKKLAKPPTHSLDRHRHVCSTYR